MAAETPMNYIIYNERNVVLVRTSMLEGGWAGFAGLIAQGKNKVLVFKNNFTGENLAKFHAEDSSPDEWKM